MSSTELPTTIERFLADPMTNPGGAAAAASKVASAPTE
jgi:hypothetical protein